MQFEQFADGSRTSLPKPSVDTGSGLERVAAVMQGTNNNYEIDLFRALIASAQQATGYDGDAANPSLRVISDHLRSMSFLIAEGVLPSNEGRGYVLRRIMRRAMRHATLLGAGEPVIHKIVPALVREMGQAYPELVRGEQMIEETVRLEEQRFLKTLSRGLALLDEATAGLKQGDMLEGVTAFKLYDTYGFPLDLTQDVLREQGMTVDVATFDAEMAAQRQRARAAWAAAHERKMTLRVAARNPVAAREALSALGLLSTGVIPLDAPDELAKALATSSILINATSVGMGDPLASPLSAELLAHLPPTALVFDMVYAPPETALLRMAQARGLLVVRGLEMLLEQGAAAFELWTGSPAPIAVMRAALNREAE